MSPFFFLRPGRRALRAPVPSPPPTPPPADPAHPECRDCCARGRCHYCLEAGLFSAPWAGHRYWACPAHREAFEAILRHDPRVTFPDEPPVNPSVNPLSVPAGLLACLSPRE